MVGSIVSFRGDGESSNFASPETRIRRGKGGGCLADDCVYRFDHDVM